MEEQVGSLLKSQGYSVTKTRRKILAAILATQPATMRQLITALPDVDRATIYRSVDLFIELQIAKKVYTGFKYRIEIGERFVEHHHHLTCMQCHQVIDVHTPEIEHAIDQTASQHGFRPIKHDLEIIGYCGQCRASSS